MKVSELIKELSGLDPDLEVILSSDAEGNSYSSARVVDTSLYTKDRWEYSLAHPDDVASGYYDQEELDEMLEGVVIWP